MLGLAMPDADLAEWKEYGDAYFGRVPLDSASQIKDEFAMFEWFMEVNKATPRARLLEWFSASRDKAALEKLSDEELLMTYCEAMVAALPKESAAAPGAARDQ